MLNSCNYSKINNDHHFSYIFMLVLKVLPDLINDSLGHKVGGGVQKLQLFVESGNIENYGWLFTLHNLFFMCVATLVLYQ